VSVNVKRGYWLAIASILLATFAQLSMKWGMSHLPFHDANWLEINFWLECKLAVVCVGAGLAAYALSTLCWLGALGYMPLNKAYPLLSTSYALVYIGTVTLPWFHEAFSLVGCLGVMCICAGVLLIVSTPERK
jgi:undecaprenyl phosphate-alpha-L-ara4N flippase subunit ArnF